MKQNKMHEAVLKFKLDPTSLDEAGSFTGYASVFGVIDSYGDIVDRGAFKKTIKEKKRFKLLWSHQSYDPGIGYVELAEDEKGLRIVKGQIYLDIQRGRDAYINMKNGTLDGISIGYITLQEFIDRTTKERHLREVMLMEVSLCNFQACPGAVVDEVKALGPQELKPFPNEHSCRLRDPDDFDAESMRRVTRKHEGKEYSVIMGKLEGEDTMTEQAYRYKKTVWDEDDAKAHCKDHDGTFEAASGKCQACGQDITALDDGQEPAKATPGDDEPQPITNKPEVLHLLDQLIGKARELNS